MNIYVYPTQMRITEPDAGHTVEDKAGQVPALESQQCDVRNNEQVSREKYVVMTLLSAVKGSDKGLR